jgi:sugar phosphate isomerase/epimerase
MARLTGRLGVCSWSLRPTGPEDLAAKINACGVRGVQLALDPVRRGAWDERQTRGALDAAGVSVLSGMMEMAGEDYSTLDTIKRTGGVRPDATWPENLAAASKNAELARRLGIELVTFHAGFLPHDAAEPERATLMQRLRDLADAFGERGVRVAFETGQETAQTLLEALDELDHDNIGVNFDPANMILYGMGDPVEALRRLSAYVAQVHIKDALPTGTPGTWGSEVVAGTGAVDWSAFFEVLSEKLPDVDLLIEREAGESRVEDVRAAAAMVRGRLGASA